MMEVSEERAREIFQHRANKNSNNVVENVQKLQDIVQNINDFTIDDYSQFGFGMDGRKIIFGEKNNLNAPIYSFHQNALQQFASKVKIPLDYASRLTDTEWGRALLNSMLNEHLLHFPKERSLIRSVDKDDTHEIRAFLSDRYKRLETGQIFQQFLTSMQLIDPRSFLYDAFVSDTRSWIDVMIPELFTTETEKNGKVWFVMGARMSSSDFGDGAFQLQTYMVNIVCNNGMTRQTMLREVHLGAKLPPTIHFSDTTHKLDTATTISKTKDIISHSFSNATIMEQINGVFQASEIIIDPKNELSKIQELTKGEKELILDELIANNPEHGVQGENSAWKLAMAMTWVGNSLDSRRQKEINEISGNFVNSKLGIKI